MYASAAALLNYRVGSKGREGMNERTNAEAFLKDFLPTLLCVRMSDIHKAWQAASMKHFALFYAAGCYAPQLCFASVPLTI